MPRGPELVHAEKGGPGGLAYPGLSLSTAVPCLLLQRCLLQKELGHGAVAPQ